jgi:hypothetical protein
MLDKHAAGPERDTGESTERDEAVRSHAQWRPATIRTAVDKALVDRQRDAARQPCLLHVALGVGRDVTAHADRLEG